MQVRAVSRGLVATIVSLVLVTGFLVGNPTTARAQGSDKDSWLWASHYIDRTESTVTADAVPSMRTNGDVFGVVTSDKYAFLAGNFTAITDIDGSAKTGIKGLAAMDIESGAWVDFKVWANGTVWAVTLSPDKKTLYVGGDFTEIWVGDKKYDRSRLAAFSVAGSPQSWNITDFRSNGWVQKSTVASLAATDQYVFAAGSFKSVDSRERRNIAAFSVGSGALQAWAPMIGTLTSQYVWRVAVSPKGDRVIMGGAFEKVNGYQSNGLAQFSTKDTTLIPMELNQVAKARRASSGVTGIVTDGDSVYASYYLFMDSQKRRWGNMEGSGANYLYKYNLKWVADCHGDTTAIGRSGNVIYAGGHNHDCVNMGSLPHGNKLAGRTSVALQGYTAEASPYKANKNTYKTHAYGNFGGNPIPYTYQWYPHIMGNRVGSNFAQAIDGNGKYLVVGGYINTTNGANTKGVVRFAVPSAGKPVLMGPSYSAGKIAAATVSGQNAIKLTWDSNSDVDDYTLNYTVYRDGQPVHTEVSPGLPFPVISANWQFPKMEWVDYGVAPGTTHSYFVKISDREGHSRTTATVKGTAGQGSAGIDALSRLVIADGPDHFWPLDSEGANAPESKSLASSNGLSFGTGAKMTTQGVVGGTNSALYLDGTNNANAWMNQLEVSSPHYSIELWVRPESAGQLIGWESTKNGASGDVGRYLFLDAASKVNFVTTHNGVQRLQSSPIPMGQWSHIVATVGPSGKALFINGKAAGSDSSVKWDVVTPGYWRLGAGAGAAKFGVATPYRGAVDYVATYDVALSAAQAKSHFGGVKNVEPAADFGVTCDGLTCKFLDFATDPNINIKTWSWNFGNGRTSSERNPSVTYANPGEYRVQLTVTDAEGLSNTRTMFVQAAKKPGA